MGHTCNPSLEAEIKSISVLGQPGKKFARPHFKRKTWAWQHAYHLWYYGKHKQELQVSPGKK
jgi:hypothetical protein